MISIFSAFTEGLRLALNEKKLLWILYGFNVFFAYLITIPVSSMLNRGMAGRPAAQEMLTEFDFTYLVSLMRDFGTGLDLGRLIWTFGLGFMLLNTFFAGGIIAAFHDSAKFTLVRFFNNCVLYFNRFLRLFLLGLLFYLLVFVIYLVLGSVFSSLTSESATEFWPYISTFIRILFLLFMIALINMLFDYAKIMTVINDFYSTIPTIKQAVLFVMMSFRQTISLYLLYAFSAVLLLLIYLTVEKFFDVTTGLMVLFYFLWSQSYLIGRIFIRMSFFSGQIIFYRHANTAMPGMTRQMLDQAVVDYERRAGSGSTGETAMS